MAEREDLPSIRAGETRENMLSRMRGALGVKQSRSIPDPPLVDDGLARLCRADEDLIARFEQQAQTVGMNVLRARSSGARDALAAMLHSCAAKTLVVETIDDELASWADGAAESVGVARPPFSSTESIAAQFSADVAITDVDAAIAETGSIVLSSGPRRSRTCHLLPRIHIAVLRAERIVPDLVDYLSQERQGDSASSVLITGPSKTADIEGVLIVGVHGPSAVHVLIVE